MTPCAMLDTRRASTDSIPLDQRLAFWEQYNASTLVGLKCSSYSDAGFTATQDNLSLDSMRLAGKPVAVGNLAHIQPPDLLAA